MARCCGPLPWVVLNAALWFGGGAAAVHVATRSPEGELESAQADRVEQALSELDLRSDQEQEVARILEEYERRVVELRGSFWESMREIESWADERLQGVLDEEQRRRAVEWGK